MRMPRLQRPTPTGPIGVPLVISRYRVLFTDGKSLDFLAHRDDSTVRSFMLETYAGMGAKIGTKAGEVYIAGVADMGKEYDYLPAMPS
jgi:hypothetical protein